MDRASNADSLEGGLDRLTAGRTLAGQFAKQGLSTADARHVDCAVRRPHHREQVDAAEHPIGAEAITEHRNVIDPIEDRKNRSIAS